MTPWLSVASRDNKFWNHEKKHIQSFSLNRGDIIYTFWLLLNWTGEQKKSPAQWNRIYSLKISISGGSGHIPTWASNVKSEWTIVLYSNSLHFYFLKMCQKSARTNRDLYDPKNIFLTSGIWKLRGIKKSYWWMYHRKS